MSRLFFNGSGRPVSARRYRNRSLVRPRLDACPKNCKQALWPLHKCQEQSRELEFAFMPDKSWVSRRTSCDSCRTTQHRHSGWGGRIRTYGTRYQKPLPYHLATPQQRSLSRNECLECLQLQIQTGVRSGADGLIVRSDFGFLPDQLIEVPEYAI